LHGESVIAVLAFAVLVLKEDNGKDFSVFAFDEVLLFYFFRFD
jgi:hypothetical protein